MRFTSVVLAAALADVAFGFVAPSIKNVGFGLQQKSQLFMALEDLESKLLGTPSVEQKAAPKKEEKKESRAKTEVALESFDDLKSLLPKSEPTKPAPVSKKVVEAPPAPKPAPLAVKKVEVAPPAPKPVPVVKKVEPAPKPAPKPEPAPKAVFAVQKEKAAVLSKKALPPPKPVAKESGSDVSTVLQGVALGSAPLVLTGLAALAAGRDLLSKTAERREQIQKELAAAAVKKAKKEAEIDSAGLIGAASFLGAGIVSLGLIVANPFADVSGVSLPSLPSINVPASAGAAKTVESKPPSAADQAREKIIAAQQERLAAKRAAREAKLKEEAMAAAEAKARKSSLARAPKGDDDVYGALVQKAADAIKVEKSSSETKKKEAAPKVAITQATLAEDEAKKALEQAKKDQLAKAEAVKAAIKAEKEVIIASEKEEADKAAAAKALAKAAAAEAQAEKIEAAAVKTGDSAAMEKAAEEAVKAKQEAEALAKKVAEDAKKEAEAAEKAARAEAAAKAAAEKAAADEAKAQAAIEAARQAEQQAGIPAAVSDPSIPVGGRVLPKEEVSDDVKAFLKSMKK